MGTVPEQALYLRWRPRGFDHVIGQQHIVQTLRNALIQNRVRHAYLFNGPRGTGKTTMARILAKAVNCKHPDPAQRPCDDCQFCRSINEGHFLDLIEIDAASHNGVDDVRDLREKIAFSPSEGRYKVYIIDEVHRFSGAAFDALLKTLEEPPEHALFILATTELDKVPATIKSRSLMFEFRRVSMREVADRLQMIVEYEGIKADRAALELVARMGTGSVRDSISLLDQLISDPNQQITLELAEQVLGTASSRAVSELVQAILDNDVAVGLDTLNRAIDEGADPAQLCRQIVEYLRNMLLMQTGGPSLVDTSDEVRAILNKQAALIGRNTLLRAIRAFNSAIPEIKGGWQPQLPLELALVECMRPIQEDALPAPVAESRPHAAIKSTATVPAVAKTATGTNPSVPAEGKTSGRGVSLADIQQAWPEILKRINQLSTPLAVQISKYATLQSLDGGKMLTLAVENPIFKQKIEADGKREILLQVLKEFFKVSLQLKVVVGGEGTPTKLANDTIQNDPVLNELMKSGGQVTSIEDSQGGI